MRSALLLALVGCAFTVQARSIDVATTARLAFPHLAAEAMQFGDFAAEYKREYASKEEVLERFSVFVNNLEKIKRANKEAKGLTTYGITPFADWSWEEFRQKMLLHGKPEFNRTALPQYKPKDLQTKHPDNWDWRVSNIVTGIKNQGGCGSCWAFATTAVVESMNAKAGRGLIDLAEQQMVDCIEDGCGGGTLQHSFGYAQDHGLPSEGDYPYQGQRGICHDAKIAAKLNQMYVLPQDEEAIANSITDGGPSAVGFEVGDTFMHYKGGIVTSHDCDGTNSWHANAAVGYGVDGGNHFWILKNSWGTGWGEGGYSRVQRGSNWCQVNCMAAAGGIW